MHPLRHQIARLRQQSRRLLLAYSIAVVVACVLAVVLVLGFADYFLRLQDHGIRLMATLTVTLVAAWAVWRYLLPLRSLRLGDVEIARRVERRFPDLADRLSSSLDFLAQSEHEATAGSAELRRAVIAQTTADVEHLRWSAAVDSRPAVRACVVALALVLLASAIFIFVPSGALTAIERLALPFSDIPWPRNHHLAFKSPVTRIAMGQDFEVELIDRNGTPPDDARIVYRFLPAGESASPEQIKPVKVGGALIARRENVVRPFEYRAIGGDDETMEWIAVEVVEPPAIESVSITVHPPRYSGRPPLTSPRRIEALRGSRVTLVGKTAKPIAAAAIRQENGPAISLEVAEQGLGLRLSLDASVPWIIDQSGKYWIELRDADGLVGGNNDQWDVRAIADEPPRITVERPIGTLYVTAEAVVPFKLKATDDLAIHEVVLHYLSSIHSELGEQAIVLYSGPEQVPAPTGDVVVQTDRGESRTIDYEWQLASLNLTPGAQLTVTASASDYLPQTGVSQPVRVVVLSVDEFEERLAAREAAILAEIRRVLKMQQETRAATLALQTQAAQVGQFRKQDADASHTAELGQRQIRRTLTSPSEGVLSQTTALMEELVANHFDSPELMRRTTRIEEEIRRLDVDELTRSEQALVAVVKTADSATGASPSGKSEAIGRIQDALTAALAAQTDTVSALEKLLDELTEWSDYRAIARDVAEIQRQQRQYQNQTQAMQPATLGRELKDLSSQQQADLQVLSGAQAELARHFDKLEQRMEQMHEKIRQSAPSAAGSIADAIELARQGAIGSDMRDSARSLEANRLGQAIDRQKTIDTKLDELLDVLANRREQELSRLVKKLRAAEQTLAALRGDQQRLRTNLRQTHGQLETAAASDKPKEQEQLARLMRQQRQLQQQIEKLGRELERLRAEESAEHIASAGEKMLRGAAAGEQGESKKSTDLADEAKKDLDQAQRQLAERRRQAEQDLAMEQLATVEHALVGLAARQESSLVETKRLHGLRNDNNAITAQQAQSLAELAVTETQLKDETDAVAEKVSAAEVFQLGVRSAAAQMKRAAGLLAQGQTGDDPQRAEQQAMLRLRQLLSALKEGQNASAAEPNQKNGDQPENTQPPQNRPAPIVHSVTEIKLLTVMQEEVNRRTIELQVQMRGRTATEAETLELTALAEEQGRIAELVAKMTARAHEEPATD